MRNALAVKPMHRVRMNGQTVSRLKRLLASATRRPPIRCELQLLCTGARLLEQSIAIMERRRTPRTSKTERRNGHEHIAPTLRLSRKPCKNMKSPRSSVAQHFCTRGLSAFETPRDKVYVCMRKPIVRRVVLTDGIKTKHTTDRRWLPPATQSPTWSKDRTS